MMRFLTWFGGVFVATAMIVSASYWNRIRYLVGDKTDGESLIAIVIGLVVAPVATAWIVLELTIYWKKPQVFAHNSGNSMKQRVLGLAAGLIALVFTAALVGVGVEGSLTVSACAASALAVVVLTGPLRAKAKEPGELMCRCCGYDLRGLASLERPVCPECGTSFLS